MAIDWQLLSGPNGQAAAAAGFLDGSVAAVVPIGDADPAAIVAAARLRPELTLLDPLLVEKLDRLGKDFSTATMAGAALQGGLTASYRGTPRHLNAAQLKPMMVRRSAVQAVMAAL